MKTQLSEPPISLLLRIFFIVEVIVLVVVGFGLFFLPAPAAPVWPWKVPLFNELFLGTVYLSALSTICVMLWSGRWTPARVGLWMLLGYTSLVLLMSLVHLARFDFHKPATWLWFLLFLVSPLVSGFELWRSRGRRSADVTALTVGWRVLLYAQAVVLGLYCICLLTAPEYFSHFWPWSVDEFHGRMYSAIFLTGAIGSFLIARVAAWRELVLVGVTEAVLGFFALLGLVSANSVKHTVQWSSAGTLLWLSMFGLLLVLGSALMWRGFALRFTSR